jgi:hypothetical protein
MAVTGVPKPEAELAPRTPDHGLIPVVATDLHANEDQS